MIIFWYTSLYCWTVSNVFFHLFLFHLGSNICLAIEGISTNPTSNDFCKGDTSIVALQSIWVAMLVKKVFSTSQRQCFYYFSVFNEKTDYTYFAFGF